MEQTYPSLLLENAVSELSKLPGIGRRTALRLSLILLQRDVKDVESLGNALISLRKDVCYCRVCHNVSDSAVCHICEDRSRDSSKVCVVATIKEVMAIENTRQYRGLYHVLGGVISPMDGIGPKDLQIESLKKRVEEEKIDEVILALSTTMEGDTTNFYIYRKLASLNVQVSVIARGVSVGDDLEYTDEVTLGRSITARTPFSDILKI